MDVVGETDEAVGPEGAVVAVFAHVVDDEEFGFVSEELGEFYWRAVGVVEGPVFDGFIGEVFDGLAVAFFGLHEFHAEGLDVALGGCHVETFRSEMVMPFGSI